MMSSSPAAWNALMRKRVAVPRECAAEQARAGADALQVFDSWVGCLSPGEYGKFVLPESKILWQNLRRSGVPVIYFGPDTTTLLEAMQETGADVIGLDWRIPLDEGWQKLGHPSAVQGNLDPVTLFAGWKTVREGAEDILRRANRGAARNFNLSHCTLAGTHGEKLQAQMCTVDEQSAKRKT